MNGDKSREGGGERGRGRGGRGGEKRYPKQQQQRRLHRSENAWKRLGTKMETITSTSTSNTVDNAVGESILLQVRDILNKLTPEKYDRLTQGFKQLRIPDESVLKSVIDLLFEKAVREPHFSGVYARLSSDLKGMMVRETDNDKMFQRVLLDKCQQVFIKFVRKKPGFVLQQDASPLSDREEQMQEYEERKMKVGTMVFIGELFNHGMLAEKIIYNVIIDTLLMKREGIIPSEEHVEMICNLFKTSGAKMNQQHIEQYFLFMKSLSTNRNLSSRHRFMLMDIIEMRANNWEARIKQEKVKTIEEINKEFKKEKMEHSSISGLKRSYQASNVSQQDLKNNYQQQTRQSYLNDSDLQSIVWKIIASYVEEEEELQKAMESLRSVSERANSGFHVMRICVLFAVGKTTSKAKFLNGASDLSIAMAKANIVSADEQPHGFKSALTHILEEELHVDAPSMLKHFGDLLGRHLAEDSLTFTDLSSILDIKNGNAALSHQCATQIVVHALKELRTIFTKSKKTYYDILRMIASSSFNMLHYLDLSNSKFINKYLEELESHDLASADPVSSIMYRIVRQQNHADSVTLWIERNQLKHDGVAHRIAVAVIASVELSTTFATTESKPRSQTPSTKQMLKDYKPVLELFPSLATDQIFLQEVEKYCISIKCQKNVPRRIFATLLQERIIDRQAFNSFVANCQNRTLLNMIDK